METRKRVIIGGVPEHFNLPLRTAVEEGKFAEKGIDVEFKFIPGGTGAMVSALLEGHIDLAVALTDALIAAISSGKELKVVGTYVTSPLVWAVSVSMDSDRTLTTLKDLEKKVYGVSRMGSGSHTMWYLLGKENRFEDTSDMKFVVKNDFEGLRNSIVDGSSDAFLWETFMTKPYHDAGILRRLGDIATPWPAFSIAGRSDALTEEFAETYKSVISPIVAEACRNFVAERLSAVAQISSEFGLREEDAELWLDRVRYSTSIEEISLPTLTRTLQLLFEIGVLKEKISPEQVVDLKFVTFVGEGEEGEGAAENANQQQVEEDGEGQVQEEEPFDFIRRDTVSDSCFMK